MMESLTPVTASHFSAVGNGFQGSKQTKQRENLIFIYITRSSGNYFLNKLDNCLVYKMSENSKNKSIIIFQCIIKHAPYVHVLF